MSLAPPMTGDGSRSSSFLPAVKCSNCGDEIEIAAMGEHLCNDMVAQPAPLEDYTPSTRNPYALQPASPPQTHPIPMPSIPPMPDAFEVESIQSPTRSRTPTLSSISGATPRAIRMPLPRINPEAANKPFLAPRFDSPMSPAVSVRSIGSSGVKPAMSRSVTSPMPRLYNPHPPSPELSANIDCAFPPFPAPINNISRPSTSNGRRTPADRVPQRPDHGLMPGQGSFDLEPKSPRLNAGESVLQKLNTLKSGPFNAKKPKSASGDSKPGSFWFGKRRPSDSPAANPQPDPVRPSNPATFKPEVEALPEKRSLLSRPARPTTEEVFSPTFLDQFSAEPSVIQPPDSPPEKAPARIPELERSKTHPLADQRPSEELVSDPLSKVQSEPTVPTLDVQPPLPNRETFESPRTSQGRMHPENVYVEDDVRLDDRTHDAPSLPKPLQQYRQGSMHAPSESGFSTVSSSNSASNSNSTNSRRPSPVTSAASSFDAFSPLSYDPIKYSDDDQMRVPGLSFKNSERAPSQDPEAQVKTPPRNLARPVLPRSPSPTTDMPSATPLESPMDPALRSQSGVTSLAGIMGASTPSMSSSQANGAPRPLRRGPMPPAPPLVMPNGSNGLPRQQVGPPGPRNWQPGRRNQSPQRAPDTAGPAPRMQSPGSARSPSTPLDPQARPASRRGTSAKAVCRGCGQVIEGKSVKAADGRLTGRWHKACFVCRSCREPFTTADFYVINNEPYCEQHYHEQNNSLCAGCHRGIEGQYIETSSTTRPGPMDMKFHPRCFTCWECRSVLSDDYFEISGKVFCERHALAAMRAQARVVGAGGGGPSSGLVPPNSRSLAAERRTTRLMMMA